jgi:hypothetical protein
MFFSAKCGKSSALPASTFHSPRTRRASSTPLHRRCSSTPIAALRRSAGEGSRWSFDYDSFDEAAAAKNRVTRKVDEAARREIASRSIFAQYTIKANEIEEDLRAVDEAIGDPKAVQDFVTSTLPKSSRRSGNHRKKRIRHRSWKHAGSLAGPSPRR